MIEILQWSTLATCGLIAAARVPSAIRGENRSLFYIFALMTAAILLSIEASGASYNAQAVRLAKSFG